MESGFRFRWRSLRCTRSAEATLRVSRRRVYTKNVAAGPCLATARRHLRAPAGAVDDIVLQLLEFGDALIDALVPYPGHRLPVFLRQRESVWQDGQLRRDFLEAEAGALPDRDVADPFKRRFTVPAMLAAALAFRGDQAEFLIVAQRRGRYAAALDHVANADQGIGIVAHVWIMYSRQVFVPSVSGADDSRKLDPSRARLGALNGPVHELG